MLGRLQRTVGENLREHRLARGLSQEAFADVLGVHRTYMGGVERGERNLTLQSVERIADQIGVDPIDLLIRRGRSRLGSPGTKSSRGYAKIRRSNG